jgi:hypothetical protein
MYGHLTGKVKPTTKFPEGEPSNKVVLSNVLTCPLLVVSVITDSGNKMVTIITSESLNIF